MQLITDINNEVLRAKTNKDITLFNDKLLQIVEGMKEFCKANNGVGLASPQVGFSRNLFIIQFRNIDKVVINPKITRYSQQTTLSLEGCLSVGKYSDSITRAKEIDVEYYDEFGRKVIEFLNGTEAIIFQHEFDHLQGKLFIDKEENRCPNCGKFHINNKRYCSKECMIEFKNKEK